MTPDQHRTTNAEGEDLAGIVVLFGRDLDFVSAHWTSLAELREPGTARPWRQTLLDPARREERARRDRAEREHRDPDAAGFTRAPEHLDVLDVMVDVWLLLEEIADRIGAALHHRPRRNFRRDVDLADVDYVRDHVADALAVDWLIAVLIERFHRSTAEIGRVLGVVRGGQLLLGAVCPFCRGVTAKRPDGDAPTLRVEVIAGQRVIVCWNGLCKPPDGKVGTWHKGRPTWPEREWDWLAKQLLVAPPTSLPPRPAPSFTVKPIEHTGRAGVMPLDRIDCPTCWQPAHLDPMPINHPPGPQCYWCGQTCRCACPPPPDCTCTHSLADHPPVKYVGDVWRFECTLCPDDHDFEATA